MKLDQKEPGEDGRNTRAKLDDATLAHLGVELRSFYRATADKPAYLGDRALPPDLENKLVHVETAIEVHEKGVEAVREALSIPPEGK
jgi:hypothetical protein